MTTKKRRDGQVGSGVMLRVTHPNGRVERVRDTGQTWPPGTMLEWDVDTPRGKQMRWTITGGGWPFDD